MTGGGRLVGVARSVGVKYVGLFRVSPRLSRSHTLFPRSYWSVGMCVRNERREIDDVTKGLVLFKRIEIGLGWGSGREKK